MLLHTKHDLLRSLFCALFCALSSRLASNNCKKANMQAGSKSQMAIQARWKKRGKEATDLATHHTYLLGFLGRSKIWSLMIVCSLPSMGGTNARPPVAIRMFLAWTHAYPRLRECFWPGYMQTLDSQKVLDVDTCKHLTIRT